MNLVWQILKFQIVNKQYQKSRTNAGAKAQTVKHNIPKKWKKEIYQVKMALLLYIHKNQYLRLNDKLETYTATTIPHYFDREPDNSEFDRQTRQISSFQLTPKNKFSIRKTNPTFLRLDYFFR